MKILVESYLGLGDTINATPLCHALYLLGHDVDLYMNSPQAERIAPLLADWPVLGRRYVRGDDIDYQTYDLGIAARGRYSLQAYFPPGLCFCVHDLHIKRRNLWVTSANLQPARLLGYAGPVPSGHARKSSRDFRLPPGTVVVHAGSRAGDLRKRWPHWPEVCERLQTAGRHVVVVGTGDDRSVDNWEVLFQPMFDLPLQDLSALLDQASFFLGNDSGVGHLAAAVGLPGLLLFGPTSDRVFRPNSVVLKTLAVNPVSQAQPNRPWNMRPDINLLSIDQVWCEIEKMLTDPRRDPPRALPQRADRPIPVPVRSEPVLDPANPDTYPSQMLEHVFAQSAAQLARGNDRRGTARMVRHSAGRAHLLLAVLPFKRQMGPTSGLRKGNIDLALDHARSGIAAGYLIRGCAVFAALWLLRRFVSVRYRLQAAQAHGPFRQPEQPDLGTLALDPAKASLASPAGDPQHVRGAPKD